jgi:uncharacterized protein (DUF3820 family)
MQKEHTNDREITPDPKILTDLTTMKMPFGKYKGRILKDLPEPYLVWFHNKGFPQGRLGMLLNTLYEIKLNGLEYLLKWPPLIPPKEGMKH